MNNNLLTRSVFLFIAVISVFIIAMQMHNNMELPDEDSTAYVCVFNRAIILKSSETELNYEYLNNKCSDPPNVIGE